MSASKTTPAYKAKITAGFAKVPGARKPSQTTPAYQAGITAAFQKFKDGQPGVAAPQSVPKAQTPRASPFYNPQQQMDLAGFNYDAATTANGVDDQFRDLTTQTDYQKAQLDTQAQKNTGAVIDDAAARGLSGSSIQAGSLADVEAQRTTQKQYLTDQLSNAKIRGDAAKEALRIRAIDFMKGMDNQAVSNADAVNSQIQPDAPAPAAAPPAPADQPAPEPQAAPPAGQWVTTTYKNTSGHLVHVFGDGHKEVNINGVWKRV